LRWNAQAREDLAKIDAYAPGEAERGGGEMERQAKEGWSLGHPIREGRERRWQVPPWAVVYKARPGQRVVKRVRSVCAG
jgi:hypothetical protein